MWNRISALLRKEFLALFKDRKSRVVLIVPPIVQLLVFGYAATFDLNRIPYALYNEDAGIASRDLASAFDGSFNFQRVASISSVDEIARLVDAKEVLLVIHIGPQFSRNLLAGKPASLQVIVDGRNSNTAMIAANYVRSIVIQFNDDWSSARQLVTAPARLET